MKIETYIDSLVAYAMNCGLTEPEDHIVATNRLLDLLRREAVVKSADYTEEGLVVEAVVPNALFGRLREFLPERAGTQEDEK